MMGAQPAAHVYGELLENPKIEIIIKDLLSLMEGDRSFRELVKSFFGSVKNESKTVNIAMYFYPGMLTF